MALLTVLPTSAAGAAAGTVAFGLLVGLESKGMPRADVRPAATMAYRSLAIELSVAVMFGMLFVYPPGHTVVPIRSLRQWSAEFAGTLSEALAVVILYVWVFALCSFISFVAAIPDWNRTPSTKWIGMLSVPGVILFVYCLVVSLVQWAS